MDQGQWSHLEDIDVWHQASSLFKQPAQFPQSSRSMTGIPVPEAPEPTGDDDRRARIRTALYKTQLCRFSLSRQCTRGAACTFAHHPKELRAAPIYDQTKICPTGANCNNQGCRYAHATDELQKIRKGPEHPLVQTHRRTGGWPVTWESPLKVPGGKPGENQDMPIVFYGESVGDVFSTVDIPGGLPAASRSRKPTKEVPAEGSSTGVAAPHRARPSKMGVQRIRAPLATDVPFTTLGQALQ